MSALAGGSSRMTKNERQTLLSAWIKPSSDDEKTQQDRAQRMVTEAVTAWHQFDDVIVKVYAKGSYANNTNVRRDSDVDIVVELQSCFFYGHKPGLALPVATPSPYTGQWKPAPWREAVIAALVDRFGATQVDTSGKVAINIAAVPGSRPSIDVVPSFEYRYYLDRNAQSWKTGSSVHPSDGSGMIVNWPEQQLVNGRAKNTTSGSRYKNYVRALKNAENMLSAAGTIEDLPSYLMECLVFNVDNDILQTGDLEQGFEATLVDLWRMLGSDEAQQMVEPNRMKWLFRDHQKWTVGDAQALVGATWAYMYGS